MLIIMVAFRLKDRGEKVGCGLEKGVFPLKSQKGRERRGSI